jgi:hypothetical protein
VNELFRIGKILDDYLNFGPEGKTVTTLARLMAVSNYSERAYVKPSAFSALLQQY